MWRDKSRKWWLEIAISDNAVEVFKKLSGITDTNHAKNLVRDFLRVSRTIVPGDDMKCRSGVRVNGVYRISRGWVFILRKMYVKEIFLHNGEHFRWLNGGMNNVWLTYTEWPRQGKDIAELEYCEGLQKRVRTWGTSNHATTNTKNR